MYLAQVIQSTFIFLWIAQFTKCISIWDSQYDLRIEMKFFKSGWGKIVDSSPYCKALCKRALHQYYILVDIIKLYIIIEGKWSFKTANHIIVYTLMVYLKELVRLGQHFNLKIKRGSWKIIPMSVTPISQRPTKNRVLSMKCWKA